MKRLVIVASGFNRNPEGIEVFRQRGWQPAQDNSSVPKVKKLVDRDGHGTEIIDLKWDEYEYGDK